MNLTDIESARAGLLTLLAGCFQEQPSAGAIVLRVSDAGIEVSSINMGHDDVNQVLVMTATYILEKTAGSDGETIQ